MTSAAPPANAANLGDAAATFGNVLSAKMTRQPADNQSSPSPSSRRGTTAPKTISVENAVKERDEKQNSEDRVATPPAVPTPEILATQSVPPIAEGNPCASKSSVNPGFSSSPAISDNVAEPINVSTPKSTPADRAGAAAPAATESALHAATQGAAWPQQTSATNPSSGAEAHAAIRNRPGVDKQEAATSVSPESLSSPSAGDESRSPAIPLASLFASASEQSPGRPATKVTATPESLTLPNLATFGSPATSQPEVTPPVSEHHTEEASNQRSEGPAVAETALPGLAPVSNVSGTAEEAQRGLPQETALPVVDDAVARNHAVPTRSPIGSNRSERKQDANLSKPPQSASNTQPDPQAQQSTIGDSPSSKTQELAQHAPATAIHDCQGKPDTPASAVLPGAVDAAPSANGARDGRLQFAFESAASSLAQNPPAAPVVIQSARVLERMRQSEMRVGLNSDGFGSIELHARVNQDQVGASIATSHTELRAAMMAEMPSLEHAIAQHQLRLDSLNVDSGPNTQTGNTGGNGGNPSGSRSWIQSGPEVSEFNDDMAAQETSLPQAWTSPHSSGLNVHA